LKQIEKQKTEQKQTEKQKTKQNFTPHKQPPIFSELKHLAKIEKLYTIKILNKLMVVENDKLYSDLRYPSLHKYLVKELGYSDAEATLRVNVVRLMLKSNKAKQNIESGQLSITNASLAHRTINSMNTSLKNSRADKISQISKKLSPQQSENNR
jgi:hypothetical protein